MIALFSVSLRILKNGDDPLLSNLVVTLPREGVSDPRVRITAVPPLMPLQGLCLFPA